MSIKTDSPSNSTTSKEHVQHDSSSMASRIASFTSHPQGSLKQTAISNSSQLPRYTPHNLKKEAQEVRQLLMTLHKAYQAFSFYPFNHPVVTQFSDHLYQALESFFQHAPYLELRLDRFRILFYDEVVFEERNVNSNFAYLLYSDGIRKLIFYAGLSLDECFRFFSILHTCSGKRSLYDDVVTLMWEESFEHIRYYLLEDLSTTLLPSFAASIYEKDSSNAEGPVVRLSPSGAPPSDGKQAIRTAQHLAKSRLSLTDSETEALQRLLLEEEQELMHRFLELMTLVLENHRESQELERLIQVLQQLLPIIISVGMIEDMLLCFKYLKHLSESLVQRNTPTAHHWGQMLHAVQSEAYSEEALERLTEALQDQSTGSYAHSIVAQYIDAIFPPQADALLKAFERLSTPENQQLWSQSLAKKYHERPRLLMPGVLASSSSIVIGTCQTVGWIGKEEGWPLLEKAYQRKELPIRIAAVQAMFKLNVSSTTLGTLLGILERSLASSHKELRIVVLHALFELGPNAIFPLKNLFRYKNFESWTGEEVQLLFHRVAHLCSYYSDVGEELIQLLLQQYNGRFQSKHKQKIPRIALQALQRENTPQTAHIIERLYQRAGKPLKRICEELFQR